MQYTLIVDLETANSQAGDEKYLFKNFGKPSDLISYVSNMSNGNRKVHKIIRTNYNGESVEMTIGFCQGKLDLIGIW